MKFVVGPRTSGVTTDLILEASKFNEPIIVPNEASARHVENLCIRYDIPYPPIYTFSQIKNPNFFRGRKINVIHISDVDAFIKNALNDYGYTGKIGAVGASIE